MEILMSRRALFLGLIPKKLPVFEGYEMLESGQQITKVIRAESFEMRVIARAEKGCVLTSEQYSWYDPIEKNDKFKVNNQIFICGEEQTEI